MENTIRSTPHPLIVMAAIAVTIFSAAGVAAIMGWLPTSRGDAARPADASAITASASDAKVAGTPPAVKSEPTRQQPSQPPVKHRVARDTAPPATAPQAQVMPPPSDARPVAVARCLDCGVIESIREVEQAGQGSGLGAVGGAVAGGVLGNQVGRGGGRDIMTIVGAVAGGIAGNQIEKKVKTTKNWEVTVRMEDGSTRRLTETAMPAWRSGDRVRFVDGRLEAERA